MGVSKGFMQSVLLGFGILGALFLFSSLWIISNISWYFAGLILSSSGVLFSALWLRDDLIGVKELKWNYWATFLLFVKFMFFFFVKSIDVLAELVQFIPWLVS